MIGPFFDFCTVDGKRERGAKMELALRIRGDRDEGDVGCGEGGEGTGSVTVAAVAVVVIAWSGSGLSARWGEGANISVSPREDVGESDVGEETSALLRRGSFGIPMNRRACSSASSRFFVLEK
jgi:hypothetical protein